MAAYSEQVKWVNYVFSKLANCSAVRRSYAVLRATPVLGAFVHRLMRNVIPLGTRVWFRIPRGVGKGLWVNADLRFGWYHVSGNYEPHIERLLFWHLKEGSVYYDVGAHLGLLSMVGARIVGNQGAVFAFEPDPENVLRIQEHVHRNALSQIHVVPGAVWSSGGKRLKFQRAIAESSRNQGAVVTGHLSENTIEVESVALDQFVLQHPPPDLIKIDVEGAEAAVLQGCENIFRSTLPILICEIHNGQAAEEVTQWLVKRDYTFKWLQDSGPFPRHLLAGSRRNEDEDRRF